MPWGWWNLLHGAALVLDPDLGLALRDLVLLALKPLLVLFLLDLDLDLAFCFCFGFAFAFDHVQSVAMDCHLLLDPLLEHLSHLLLSFFGAIVVFPVFRKRLMRNEDCWQGRSNTGWQKNEWC